MWSKRFAAAMVCASLATTGVLAQKELKLLVTVTDPSGNEIQALEPADVRITENDAAATVLSVQPVERAPKFQLLVDNGNGMPASSLGELKTALRAVIEALPPGVETTIVTTAPQPRFLERATTDKGKLLSSFDRLAPDTGTGKFVDSLYEATDRVEKDKQEDARYTILAVGTTSGDASGVRERDMQRILERVQKKGITVHVVLLNAPVGTTASGGAVQTDLGQAVTGASNGRFEKIAVANRLNSLLPDVGKQIASTMGKGAKQFRVTFARPAGANGELGKVSIGVTKGAVASVAMDRN